MVHDNANVKVNINMIMKEDAVVSIEDVLKDFIEKFSFFFFSGGDYEAPCDSSLDCQSNLICNKTTLLSFCSCDAHYQYYPSLRKCRGNPGAVCDRATAECVDNAECRDGACECSNQFIADENKVCSKKQRSHLFV